MSDKKLDLKELNEYWEVIPHLNTDGVMHKNERPGTVPWYHIYFYGDKEYGMEISSHLVSVWGGNSSTGVSNGRGAPKIAVNASKELSVHGVKVVTVKRLK